MIEITKERAAEIRKSLEGWPGEGVEESEVRTLLRLGLGVVESGVTATEVAEMADAVDGEQDPRLAAMLDALAAELEKSR